MRCWVTDTQTKNCNPRCACAPRVNNSFSILIIGRIVVTNHYNVSELKWVQTCVHSPQHDVWSWCKLSVLVDDEPSLQRLSQLQSGFIQVQVVIHLVLQGFSVTPLVQWRFLVKSKLGCRWNHFVIAFVCNSRYTVKTEMLLWSKVCCFSWMLDTNMLVWVSCLQ